MAEFIHLIKLCQELGIDHRTTQFKRPWTNGQVEITNKIIKQATTKRFYYKDFEQLKKHLMTFMLYYNHQRPLKSLKFKTPWELIQQCYYDDEQSFRENPNHKIVGLNSYRYIHHLDCQNLYIKTKKYPKIKF